MDAIGSLLGFSSPKMGVGSSVHGDFTDLISEALNVPKQSNKNKTFARVIEHLGGTYDPWTDSSEKTKSGGGGTITNAGLHKLRNLLLAAQSVQQGGDVADADDPVQITQSVSALTADTLDPATVEDARIRQLSSITKREGAGKWRASLLSVFGGTCVVTQWDVNSALDAAHIVPYKGPQTNTLGNGLLLRSDIHTLFDRGLLTITPTALVRLHPSLDGTRVWTYNDTEAALPAHKDGGPDPALLDWHGKNIWKG